MGALLLCLFLGQTTLPTQLTRVDPRYPRAALEQRARATVTLELDLDEHGQVEASRLSSLEGSPGLGFVEAATEAAKGFSFTPATVDGAPAPSTVSFTFHFEPPDVGRLAGLVTRRDGTPVSGAHVQAWSTLEGHTVGSRATADAHGAFAFASLPPGLWHVEAAAQGLRRAEKTVTVSADGSASVTLVLEVTEEPKTENYDVLVERDDGRNSARTFEDPTAVMKMTASIGSRGPAAFARAGGPGGRGGPGGGRGGPPPGGGPPGGGGGRGGTPPTGAPASLPGTSDSATAGVPTGSEHASLAAVTASGGLDLRGTNPALSRFFLEGIEVPGLFHFSELQRPVLPKELISSVDYAPGNFPVDFGRATMGLINVGVDEPAVYRLELFPWIRPTLIPGFCS
jgi:TonB family protein